MSLKIVLYGEPVKVQNMSAETPVISTSLFFTEAVRVPRTLPTYRVTYTIKYSACDLNDMPEQLYRCLQ